MTNINDLNYVSDLKIALKNFGDIDEELTILKLKRDEIKENIKKWVKLNNIEQYETLDISEKNLWRLTLSTMTRKDINYTYLEEILTPEQLEIACKYVSYESFKCSKVKSRKKQSTKIEIPQGALNV